MPSPHKRSQPEPGALVNALLKWYRAKARDLPWRRTRDPYAIWVSEIMLQQTQVKTVIPYWERWMRELPTVKALAEASSDKIHKLWEGLGYYTRVRNLQKAAQQIIAEHDARVLSGRKLATPDVVSCKFPESFDAILALPGIGRYTAGAICSIAFNQPTPILDGNVIRVLTRIFAIDGQVRDKAVNEHLWKLAEELVTHAKSVVQTSWSAVSRVSKPAGPCTHPADLEIGDPAGLETRATLSPQSASCIRSKEPSCSHLNQSLMELGALICTPRAPQCPLCPVQKLCLAHKQGRVEQLPNLNKRARISERRFAAFVVVQGNRFLVRQRPAGVVNAHLWEFPNAELLKGQSDFTAAAKHALGFHPGTLQPLCTIKHSITRYRITLEAFSVSGIRKTMVDSQSGRWLTLPELRKLSFPSAHRKILNRLG